MPGHICICANARIKCHSSLTSKRNHWSALNIRRSPVFHKNSKRIGRCHVNHRCRVANRENAAKRIVLGGSRATDGKRAAILLSSLEVVDPLRDRLNRVAIGIFRQHSAPLGELVVGDYVCRDPLVKERDALDNHSLPRLRTSDSRPADADTCYTVGWACKPKSMINGISFTTRKVRYRGSYVYGRVVISRIVVRIRWR